MQRSTLSGLCIMKNQLISDKPVNCLHKFMIYLFVELRHILWPSITMCCALTNRTQRFRNRLGPAITSHNV